ncbi:HAD-IA family hydrolase [Halobacillus sp. A5]|uniref:HAD family hydrolase n=1 Tax=Halobacillus sp. A5 TaxID=2880263 RepID=UPI0020A6308B|nr:HAD family hydrolase [Halobacillus sp. A5]
MIKAVLFDLDGTLLNRDQSLERFARRQYSRFHTLRAKLTESHYVERFMKLDEKGYVPKELVYASLAEEFNITETLTEELIHDYFDVFHQSCIAFPKLTCMLNTLKNQGYQLGIITNGRDPFQMQNIRALEIEHYFDVILISEKEGLKKPDPRIFHRALNRINVMAEESVFVGDHPEKDIQAALSVGMHSVLKKDDYWSADSIEHVISELDEIPDIIKKLCS